MSRETLYDSIHQVREVQRKTTHRIMLSGYFNQEEVKRQTVNTEQYIRESLKQHPAVKSYLYIKGVFYIHILQSSSFSYLNAYLQAYDTAMSKRPTLLNSVRVVHQSYQNPQPLFKGFDCDNNPQAGPILSQTQKTQEQIQDRSFQIYELFMEGARKRSETPSHRIGNMILLSNDDMGLLISSRFMSLGEYCSLYIGEINVDRDYEFSYPLAPSFFQVMEFLECQDYRAFGIS